jgi:hypothetical protein
MKKILVILFLLIGASPASAECDISEWHWTPDVFDNIIVYGKFSCVEPHYIDFTIRYDSGELVENKAYITDGYDFKVTFTSYSARRFDDYQLGLRYTVRKSEYEPIIAQGSKTQ